MMKKKYWLGLIPLLLFYLAGCSPSINLDFLGQEKMQEVILVESRAKAKITVIDLEGVISSNQGGLFSREGDALSRVYQRLE
ncbi:MAG: hypothetical protein PHQ25_07465, partial [Acidobacteriota bacterium]|nr:hypothetical protein [Acidobacteriota bacterium]